MMIGWLKELFSKWRWNRMAKYTADFETTTNIDDCRVWAFAWCDIENTSNWAYGNSIDDFMEWLQGIDDSKVYFHNLKFDVEFIFNWLYDNGWEWTDDIKNSPVKTFSTLISDQGNHYSCKLKFSKFHTVELLDSLKVIPLPIAKIPKAFGFDNEDTKKSIDYEEFRAVGHVLTEDEIEYIREDVVIAARALKVLFDQGDTKMTAGSNAIANYKRSVGGEKNSERCFQFPTMTRK